jgi:hypothetical protein
MSKRTVEKRFIFHANAVALAAHVRRPDDYFIPAVASSCLPVTGGKGNAKSPAGSFKDLISYGSASSDVSGDFVPAADAVQFTHGNHWRNNLSTATSAECQITDLKMMNGNRRVEARQLRATLASISDRRRATAFHTLSADFNEVSIDGHSLSVTTCCEIFTDHPTKQKLVQGFAGKKELRDRFAHCFFGQMPGSYRRRIPEFGGIIVATVVSKLAWTGDSPEHAVISGNSVKIEGFGTLYFGEIMVEQDFRRLTLIRFELGSPVGGDGSIVDLQANGTSWPPQ